MPSTPKKSPSKPDIKIVLGQQIRKLRVEAGMSQQALSEKCDIFRTYVSRVESGEANPTVTVLAAIAAGLNVDIRDLFAD